jgi:lipopolysaccharide transport system permease protein
MLVYGTSLLLSSLYVYFRDLNQIWEVLTQIGFFACPIMYSLDLINKMPEQLRSIYMLNPVTLLIEMYRDIFLGGTIPNAMDVALVLAFGIALMAVGTVVFRKLSRRFAEEV